MAATTTVKSYHGSSPTPSTVTAAEFKWADDDTADGLTRIRCTLNDVYSFRKSLKLSYDTAPVTSVADLVVYMSSPTVPTGATLYGKLSATYVRGTVADETAVALANMVDMTTYTSGSPLSVQTGTIETSGGVFPSTGTQDYLVLQLKVTNRAANATAAMGNLVYSWTES
jgi:hypothetical protein